jgi:hypothetical protein
MFDRISSLYCWMFHLFRIISYLFCMLLICIMFVSVHSRMSISKCYLSEVCSAERTLVIVRMCSPLNYSEHCRLEASAIEQSRVFALLNRPQMKYHKIRGRDRSNTKLDIFFVLGIMVPILRSFVSCANTCCDFSKSSFSKHECHFWWKSNSTDATKANALVLLIEVVRSNPDLLSWNMFSVPLVFGAFLL